MSSLGLVTPDSKEVPLRLGLVGAGLILFDLGSSFWHQGESFLQPLHLGLSFAAWAAGIACFVLAMATALNSRWAWLVLGSLVCALWGSAYLARLNDSPLTTSHPDNEMVGEYAAQAFRHGYNPYRWNFADAARAYRDQGTLVTAFLDGSTQNRLTYPALPTLLLAGLDAFGLGQARVISLFAHTLLLVLLFVGSPAGLRPLVLLAMFVVKSFNLLTLGGVQDVVWSTLLVAMVLAWNRPALRAVLFGLACAYRQQPWLVAPFLLISMWNESGTAAERRRRIGFFLAVSLGVFVLLNLPFILWDPRAWALGVFEPVYAAFNVYSQGLGALSQYGIVPLPRQFYTGLQLSSLALMLALHWRHPRAVGTAFWAFPAIFLWLYYRGLANYWIYWIPPMLIALVNARWEAATSRSPAAPEPARRRRTLDLAMLAIAANLIWGVVLLQRQPPVAADYLFPLETGGGELVARLAVRLTNASDRVFHPRFAVQRDRGGQPLPWAIESGPEVLGPGESGQFVIRARASPQAFAASQGGQVVVTDAGGDYELRAVLAIPPDPTFRDPDRIVNPALIYWSSVDEAPSGWSLESTGGSLATARIEVVDGQTALAIYTRRTSPDAGPALTRLAQAVTFPAAFTASVYPTIGFTHPLQEAYGLELDDGERRLWILFGDSEGGGMLAENHAYVVLPAPSNRWTKHTIEPPQLYERFRWPLPRFTVRRSNGLEFAARQVRLSLLVVSRSEESLGFFGPIAQASDVAHPDRLVAEALAHPDAYYANLGDEYDRQRNYDLAEGAYRRALAYNDRNAYAYSGLGWSLVYQGRCAEAAPYFKIAGRIIPDLPEALRGLERCR